MASTVERAEYAILQGLLKRTREGRGMSQRALSAKLGKMSSYVQKLENGERRLDVIELIRICDLLEVDETTFLKELRMQVAEQRAKLA